MKFEELVIGNGKPHIAVVGCVHGDEILGEKVLDELKNTRLRKGALHLILANPEAVKAKKRFLQSDLNRSFPGKKAGQEESRLAYELHEHLKRMDVVIDIHATNARLGTLIICTSLTTPIKKILSYIPIKRVAVVRKKVFGGSDMISHFKRGVSIEYGSGKSGKNYMRVARDVHMILHNLGVISGKKQRFSIKDVFIVTGQYNVPSSCKVSDKLREYVLIKKGQIVGYVKDEPIIALYSFYPLFLGEGGYVKTLCLVAKTRKKMNV